jgi:hypothetical protein
MSAHAGDEESYEWTRVLVPTKTFATGQHSFAILAPMKANRAKITMERTANWPSGTLFTWNVYERDRNTSALRYLAGATETGTGSAAAGKDGAVNPPLTLTCTWPVDADRDWIQLDLAVVQAFQSRITMEFAA